MCWYCKNDGASTACIHACAGVTNMNANTRWEYRVGANRIDAGLPTRCDVGASGRSPLPGKCPPLHLISR